MQYIPNYKNSWNTQKEDTKKGDYAGASSNWINTMLDPANVFGGRSDSAEMDFPSSPYAVPEYNSPLNGNNNLAEQYLLKDRGGISSPTIGLNTEALTELQKEGLAAPGTSAWEQMMQDKNNLMTGQQRDAAMQSASGANADAMSRLETSGGMSGGARERLAKSSANNTALARQQVAGQGAINSLGIGTQAEQNRLGILSALPGQQLGASGFNQAEAARQAALDTGNRDYSTGVQQFNIGNDLNAIQNQNNFKQQTYQNQMTDWAAMNAAKATAKGGGKGGGK